MPSKANQPLPAPSKVMKVTLWLGVENINSCNRGKKNERKDIEDWILSRHQMTKARPDGW
jgi:hypothetical protein